MEKEKAINSTLKTLSASISHEIITSVSCITNLALDSISMCENKQCNEFL